MRLDVPGTYSYAELYAAARKAGFPPEEAKKAAAVALAESDGRLKATNTYTDNDGDAHTVYGPWQISDIHGFPVSQLFTLQGNAKAAFEVWKNSSRTWVPWSVCGDAECSNIDARPGADNKFVTIKDNKPAVDFGKPLDILQTIIEWFSDPTKWLRVVWFILGALLFGAGVYALVVI